MTKLKKIPLFPLNMVVLPKEQIPLHIFEKRYKKMVDDCINQDTEFGIVFIKNDLMEKVGCSISIEKVLKKYTNGKYDLMCKGDERFKIKRLHKNEDLWYADVEYFTEDYSLINKKYLEKTLDKYLKILMSINPNMNFQNELKKNISFDFVKNVVLPREIKQIFLNLKDEKSRLKFINNFLDSLSKNVNNDVKLKKEFYN
ncbi:MAG: hypothetical protein CBC84_000880 [Pelagibacteraceae bacterium TMED124]|nr:hypothetical protein [Candidatus Neomarinimicrobiota bacterium]RPG19110.1 MAG: hypothetical protein CBC84_000880 [Pelagibacteraceae bacterium TMED124]|tara:strand:- start:12891 stop:13490 length:600 start_codon:yes stop_codon:yes gene_type:complete